MRGRTDGSQCHARLQLFYSDLVDTQTLGIFDVRFLARFGFVLAFDAGHALQHWSC